MARDRSFTIALEDYESETAFRQAVQQAMLDCEATGHREGGGFKVSPIRVERESRFVNNGEPLRDFVTIGWVFQHTFMPAARVAEPAPDLAWDTPVPGYEEEVAAREAEEEPQQPADEEPALEPVEAE